MKRIARFVLALVALALVIVGSSAIAPKPQQTRAALQRAALAAQSIAAPASLGALRVDAGVAPLPAAVAAGAAIAPVAVVAVADPGFSAMEAPAESAPVEPSLPPPVWIPGDGPWMRGTLVAQTERLDFYIGRGTFSEEEVRRLAQDVEWALNVMEQRFGERLQRRVSIGIYRSGPRNVRGLAFTDEGRVEMYYRPGESLERAGAVATHELAHHLQAQRYGVEVQRRADTILLEGAATWIASDRWLPMTGASDWRARARQLRDSGVPLRLKSAESYGANTAYELWASFVHYILSVYGFEYYRPLYASGRGRALGSADYEGVLGKSLDELAAEWRAWIDR